MINEIIINLKAMRSLKGNIWLTTSQLEELQNDKLIMLLDHAYHNVPYYRHLLDSSMLKPEDIKNYQEISKIPITTKAHIQKSKQDMLARNIRVWVEHKTSGSTGISLVLAQSMEDAIYNRATYERARVENGFKILTDKLVYIGSPFVIPKKKHVYEYFGIRRKDGINVFDPLERQIETLKKINPDALWGYASAIKEMAKIIKEEQIERISPRIIFTCSEMLVPESRNLIISAFKLNPIDAYASWEGGCMAWECSEHAGYHINMDHVLMEFVDENGQRVKKGERGKVVITNLHSYAMPIIRYELGDYAVPTYEECRCGRGGYLIKNIEGRCDDFIKLSSGQIVAPPIIWSIIKSIPGISEFQVVQESEGEIVVYVVRSNKFSEVTIDEETKKGFNKIIGNDASINTRFVERIEREKSGKLRSVISRIQ